MLQLANCWLPRWGRKTHRSTNRTHREKDSWLVARRIRDFVNCVSSSVQVQRLWKERECIELVWGFSKMKINKFKFTMGERGRKIQQNGKERYYSFIATEIQDRRGARARASRLYFSSLPFLFAFLMESRQLSEPKWCVFEEAHIEGGEGEWVGGCEPLRHQRGWETRAVHHTSCWFIGRRQVELCAVLGRKRKMLFSSIHVQWIDNFRGFEKYEPFWLGSHSYRPAVRLDDFNSGIYW